MGPEPTKCFSDAPKSLGRGVAGGGAASLEDPQAVSAHHNLSVCRFLQQDFEAGIRHCHEALRIDPRSVLETREHFIPNAYPVYARDYARDALLVREALARVTNLETLGRAGRFVYSHLHDQLRFGKTYVRELTASRRAHSA